MAYEYKTVGAPERGKRTRDSRSGSDRAAAAMQDIIQAEAAEGWEYLRTDLIPVLERVGWLSRPREVHRAVLIFRRALPVAQAPRMSAGFTTESGLPRFDEGHATRPMREAPRPERTDWLRPRRPSETESTSGEPHPGREAPQSDRPSTDWLHSPPRPPEAERRSPELPPAHEAPQSDRPSADWLRPRRPPETERPSPEPPAARETPQSDRPGADWLRPPRPPETERTEPEPPPGREGPQTDRSGSDWLRPRRPRSEQSGHTNGGASPEQQTTARGPLFAPASKPAFRAALNPEAEERRVRYSTNAENEDSGASQ